MRVSTKMTRLVFEASEAVGLRREDLVPPSGPDVAFLSDPHNEIEWTTYVALLERMADLVDQDVDRTRGIGRAVCRAPSYDFLQGIARTVLSPHRLYEAGARWVAPATCPHLTLEQTFVSENRLRVRASIPQPHAPCETFFHVFEGVLQEIPTLLGLPRATIVSSAATPRVLEVLVDLPRSRSLLGRARRALRALLYSGEALDLLEQQRCELEEGLASMQQSTGEFHALFDRLPDLVIIHRNGEILWMNRAVLKVLGYDESTIFLGRSLLELLDPASQDLFRSRMYGQGDAQEAPDLLEAKLVARDGSHVLVEVFPAQTVSFGGSSARLVVGRDITERVRMQQQLLTADRMASIGMLAAGVAHEVNNPLAYVLNNVEMAIKDLTPLGDSTRRSREALGVALEGVDRIRTIVRELLELSRVDDGAVGPVDARAVVESTLTLAAQKIGERAELETDLEAAPLARGTASRLGQVLLNLVSNALESMPVERRATNRLRVSVRTSSTGGAIVEVTDNGVGIASEHMARIFDPFFTTKEPGAGTGIGLAISQRLVAEMGGALTFDSIPGRGSTFRVTLAAAGPDDALDAVLAPGAHRRSRTKPDLSDSG